MNMIIQLDNTSFKRRVWKRALDRVLKKYEYFYHNNTEIEKQAEFQMYVEKYIFYGIKNYGKWEEKINNRSIEALQKQYSLNQTIFEGMKRITPRQFMGWFPITKNFDGQLWEMKDYFHTMAYINSIGIDEPIKDPFTFLWEYMNKDTMLFLVNHTGVMSGIREQETGMGIMEEFLFNKGIELKY